MKSKSTILGYYLANFCVSLEFILPVWLIFFTVTAGFSVTQAMFLGSIGYFLSTILEIPTGIVADKYGPKFSYFVGAVLVFISSLFFLLTPNFWLYFGSAIILGFGLALMSGCAESLIFEYLKENDVENEYTKITSTKQSVYFIGRVVSSLSGAYIFLINPVLPFILVGFAHLLSCFFIFKIRIQKPPKTETLTLSIFKQAVSKIREILIQYPISKVLLISILVQIILMDFYFYSYPLLLKDLNLSFEFSGYVFAFVSVFSALGSQLYHKFFAKKDFAVIFIILLSILAMAALIYSSLVWAFILALFVQGVVAGFIYPSLNSFWQPKIEQQYRTTVLSIFSFLMGVISTLSGFMAGVLIDSFGIGNLKFYALVASVIFIVPFVSWASLKREVLKNNF
jgi:MFS family permease